MSRDIFSRLVHNAEFRAKWREDRDYAEKLLDQRQKRYASDPSYRASIKASVRKNRKKKKKEQGPNHRRRSFNRDRVITVNGNSVFLYSSGKAARLIGVTIRALELWERNNAIPINKTTDNIGRRWYPADFVTFMAEHVAELIPDLPFDEWSARVKESWQTRQSSGSPIHEVCERLDQDDQGNNADGH
jgi:transcriptional regulator with XRE-family HTH domain